MRISKWYWAVLFLWAFTGLPIMIIGIGFAGPDIFTLEGLASILIPDLQSFKGFISWFISFVIVFLPFLVLPFVVKRSGRSAS